MSRFSRRRPHRIAGPVLTLLLLLMTLPAPLAAAPLGQEPDPPDHFVYLPMVLLPGEPRSSEELIDAAIETGTITPETGLAYKVFAAFGDPRLPASYRGSSGMVTDSHIGFELAERYDSLSPGMRAQLAPFLLPPNVAGSWYQLRSQALAIQAAGAAEDPAPTQWFTKDTDDGKVRVWMPQDMVEAGYDLDLSSTVDEVQETMWPKAADLLSPHEPLPDAGDAATGDSPALDIFLIQGLSVAGVAVPINKGSCYNTPVFIQIDIPAASALPRSHVVAHELMHAFISGYPVQNNSCEEYLWLDEATADWFMDYAWGGDYELPYAKPFLDTPHLSVNDDSNKRYYGAWMLLHYLTNLVGDDSAIGAIWEKAITLKSLDAIDQAVPDSGGFDTWWDDFADDLWNRDYADFFQTSANLKLGARPEGGKPIPVTMSGGHRTIEMKLDLPRASARFYHFTFPDDRARSVQFYNGAYYKLSQTAWPSEPAGNVAYDWSNPTEEETRGARVDLYVKYAGQDWQYASAISAVRSWCRDLKAERLEEMVVVFSNSEIEEGYTLKPSGLPPMLFVQDIGCWQWQGTVNMERQGSGSVRETATTNVVMERRPGIRDPRELSFGIKSGLVTYGISGTDADGDCSYSGSGSWTIGGDLNGGMYIYSGLLSGPYYRGYNGSGTAHRVTVTRQCSKTPSNSGTYDATFTSWEFTSEESTDFLPVVPTGGGTLSGTSDWGATYNWSLSARREP